MSSTTAVVEARGFGLVRFVVLSSVCAALIAAFLFIAGQVKQGGPITDVDRTVGKALQEEREEQPFLRVIFMAFTMLAAFETMIILVPLIGIFLWRRGRVLAILWLCVGTGAGVINASMKRHYERERPPWKDAWAYENNESFPSGHAFSCAAVFGLLVYILARFRRRYLVSLVVGGISVILVVGFSRVFLGAHYLSDVLAGYCCGAAWALLWIMAIEALDLIPSAAIG